MAQATLNIEGRWQGFWRVRLGYRVLALGARLIESAGFRVSVNGKPWRDLRVGVDHVELSVRSE